MPSFLEIITSVIDESANGSISGGIINNANEQARRLKAISNRVIAEMSERYPWRELWRVHTITLVDGQSSYALPADFNFYHLNTFWNQSDTIPLVQLNSEQLSALDGLGIDNLDQSQFYIRGVADNQFMVRPTPDSDSAGTVLAFNYASNRAVRPKTWETSDIISAVGTYRFYNGNYYKSTNTGTTGATAPTHTTSTESDGTVSWAIYNGGYDAFLADTDVPVLSPRIFAQGILERLSYITGQNVAPLFEAQLRAEFSRQAPAPVINVTGDQGSFTYARNGKAYFSTGR